jgi:cell fate regulator YaaT (PSP1 superfamily)
MIDSMISDNTRLATDHLCRIGCHGQVGRLRSKSAIRLQRNDRVVCRTARGIELGEVLAAVEAVEESELDGTLLRRMTPEDDLLWRNLREMSDQALAECQTWLTEQGSTDTLLEVEPLLDGQTLYFHFVGEPTPDVAEHLKHLASLYEQRVRESKFAELLENGCGPGCGTESKGGCGTSGGCAVCVVASACKKK